MSKNFERSGRAKTPQSLISSGTPFAKRAMGVGMLSVRFWTITVLMGAVGVTSPLLAEKTHVTAVPRLRTGTRPTATSQNQAAPYLSRQKTTSGLIECQLPATATPKALQKKSTPIRKLVLRGGGWEEESQALTPLMEGTKGSTALVMSATTLQAPYQQWNTDYFYDFYTRGPLRGTRVNPVFTRPRWNSTQTRFGAVSPNSQANVDKIRQAARILITGGNVDRLEGLAPSATADAIRAKFKSGTPVYGNSAALAVIGNRAVWDKKVKPVQSLGLIDATLLSHLNEPQKWGSDFLADLWSVVPQQSPRGLGLTGGTVAVSENDVIRVIDKGNPRHRLYVYDRKLHPPTKACQLYYIGPGQSYDLYTGHVSGSASNRTSNALAVSPSQKR